jgi:putative PIN family toxin of toxin-antitoxin system
MNKDRLVYDCNVYLQFLLNHNGAAGQCVSMAMAGNVELFVSPEILLEIQELPQKKIGLQRGLTQAMVRQFTDELLEHAVLIEIVPVVYTHPIDPDDSPYINLAIAAQAKLVVSNDNHLLNLSNPDKPWSLDFRNRFPEIRVLKPAEYLEIYKQGQRSQNRDG